MARPVLFLSVSVVLLSWLTRDVRCEMRKSWKVKSEGGSSVTEQEPQEYQKMLTKLSRMEPDPVQEVADVRLNAVDSETESITEQPTSPTTTSTTVGTVSSSTTGAAQTTTRARLRSTYVANRTSSLFNSIRESVKAAPFLEDHEPDIQIDDFSADDVDEDEFEHEDHRESQRKDGQDAKDAKDTKDEQDPYAEGYDMIDNILEEVKSIAVDGEKPNEKEESKPSETQEKVKQYDFGPVLNMTIDEPNNIVRVKLNDKVLKDIFTGRAEGGGFGTKKLWKYAMPLFVLPFLIQSAVVPFMLMTVKLFLFKSFMAGKLAILLLLLGAFKNFSNKKDKEVYVKDLPERRYEPYNEWPYPYHGSSESGRPAWAK